MGRSPQEGRILPANRASELTINALSELAMGRLHIDGVGYVQEAIESREPIVLIGGPHRSHADGPIIHKALRQIEYPYDVVTIQGKKLDRRLLTGTLVKGVARIQVWPAALDATEEEIAERNTMNMGAVRAAREVLRDGGSLLIFPEGTRSDGMKKADPASAVFFKFKNIPGIKIVPFGIIGGDQVLPKGAVFPRRHTPTVRFGKAIEAAELKAKYKDVPTEDNQRMIDDVMVEIGKMLPEEYWGEYYGTMIKDYETTHRV